MEKKTGLNNQQRKMLDEIYTEQFEKTVAPILFARRTGLEKLRQLVIKKESSKAPIKQLLEVAEDSRKLYEKTERYLSENGLNLSNRIYETRLEINHYGGVRHPEIVAYEEETCRIEADLAKRKKEIRARIYGMDTTYQDVEKEVSKYIADIKV